MKLKYNIQRVSYFKNNELNFGRQDKRRVRDAVKYGLIYTLIIMLVGAIGLQILAHPLIHIFDLSGDTERLCILAIRIITIGYLFIGANVAFQGIFQALGNGMYSLIVSLIRQIIVVFPLAFILSRTVMAENIVWITFPIAEGVALILSLYYYKKITKNLDLKEDISYSNS